MIAVREDKMKELNVHPFDLTPGAVAEDDQLIIPQHPLTKDYKQPTPLGISLGPCKKMLGNLSYALFIAIILRTATMIMSGIFVRGQNGHFAPPENNFVPWMIF